MIAGPLAPLGPHLAAAAWAVGLAADPTRADALITKHGRRMARLVGALAALGYLDVERGVWRGPGVDEKPGVPWGDLATAVLADRPLEPGGERSTHENYLRSLATWAEAPAHALAARLANETLPAGAILDVGGGLATYARTVGAALARRVVLFDQPAVIEMVNQIDHAVEGHAVDLVAEAAWPMTNAAVVLVCNVLHLYDATTNAELLARAAAEVASGGLLLVRELVLDPDGRGALRAALFAFTMAMATAGGDVYDEATITSWIARHAGAPVVTWPIADEPESRWFVWRRP